MNDPLPIHEALPGLLDALQRQTGAVLIAPPGAGKTTAVAPALLGEDWCGGTVVLTSPRRVAARAAAERMAQLLGEEAGQTIGYLTRLDSRRSAATRVLVVTEAIFVTMILEDPELAGVSAVLLDEAHERHLDADLGLALALETQAILREDLRIVVMSATLDGARYARLLGDGAPVVESRGQAYPLRIEWLGSRPQDRLEDAMTSAIVEAWRAEEGDILAFLPGVKEIARVHERLSERLAEALILPLHGQVQPQEQRAAIRRDPDGRRRIVLATAIAETSLTLDGVTVVVDSGLSRRAVFDRRARTTHLVTARSSQAASAQRAGRAARQGPGVAYRLWEEAAHPGRPPFDPPEILTADLAPLLLALARWGTGDPHTLRWLDPPPAASVTTANNTLRALGTLDKAGRLTPLGRMVASLPLDPASGAMVIFGAQHGAADMAAQIALLLQERNLGGQGEDLEQRRLRWANDRSARATGHLQLAQRWARKASDLVAGEVWQRRGELPPPAVILAAGRPGFIARRRDSAGEQWLSAGGRGFVLDPASPLARAEYLVIGDAQGQARGARITAAIALDEADIARWLDDRIERKSALSWNGQRLDAIRESRLGAIVLSRGPDPEPDEDAIVDNLVDKAVDELSILIPTSLVARGRFAGIEALSVISLKASADLWLRPLLKGRRDITLPADRIAAAVLGMLDYATRQRLDRDAPKLYRSPAGSDHPISYDTDDAPSVEVRVQALFGEDRHPMIGPPERRVPLLLKLTSPAGRPVQSTADLPGFWRGTWADVRKDMKGRYPKHRWPEEPSAEAPSLMTKNAFARQRG